MLRAVAAVIVVMPALAAAATALHTFPGEVLLDRVPGGGRERAGSGAMPLDTGPAE